MLAMEIRFGDHANSLTCVCSSERRGFDPVADLQLQAAYSASRRSRLSRLINYQSSPQLICGKTNSGLLLTLARSNIRRVVEVFFKPGMNFLVEVAAVFAFQDPVVFIRPDNEAAGNA